MYKSVVNNNYLCHYNQNHSKKNGQFVSGDGDGDGITNDHANQKTNKGSSKKKKIGKAIAIGIGATALSAVSAYRIIKTVKNIKLTRDELKKQQALGEAFAERFKQMQYRSAASNAKYAGGDW